MNLCVTDFKTLDGVIVLHCIIYGIQASRYTFHVILSVFKMKRSITESVYMLIEETVDFMEQKDMSVKIL